ncbi:MAG: KH domain-containing protein [Armatimonadetes bacterium]|nr:KH domain-containing protein [Armatimonadota bacterium]
MPKRKAVSADTDAAPDDAEQVAANVAPPLAAAELEALAGAEPEVQAAPDERDLAALDIVREMCEAGDLAMRPEIKGVDGSYLKVELIGEDANRIFGEHGRMLDALQFLANLIISRRLGPGVRVLLDAAGYRERRLKMLADLATEYASEVKARHEECEIDSLPPHERRIIHQLLSEDPDVITYSEGEEPDRRIIIAPKDTTE